MQKPRLTSPEQAVAWGVVAVATAYVLWQVNPLLVLTDTTPTQGDLGGHLHEAAHLRDNLLPHWRLSGWSQDWFTGYPSLTFYFPLGALLTVVLDLLVPYNVATKLVAAVGPVLLPIAAYAFGRLSRCDRLTSACFGASVIPLLLRIDLFPAGGSLASSIGGEYAYGIGLVLALLVLGVARAGLRTGRHRGRAAALLAAAVLLHVVAAMVAVVGILVSVALRPAWARLRWTGPILAVAGALAGFWVVPFLLRGTFTAGPDYPKAVPVSEWLFPSAMAPIVVVAFVGLVAAFIRRILHEEDTGVFLVAMAALSGAAFALTPTGRLWNARFLSVWFLWLSMLAGYGLASLGVLADELRRRSARGGVVELPALARLAAPVVVLVAVLVLWDSHLARRLVVGSEPFDTRTLARSFVEGYERSEHRAEYPTVIDTLRRVGREHGCGRAHFEWDERLWSHERLPFLWLIPYWTDGCIGVTQGLYSQSSATSPYVDLTNSRLSPTPVVLNAGERRDFDVAAGVADLRILGVRYFIAALPETKRAADAEPGLRAVAELKPSEGSSWKIYEVPGVETIEPLEYEPVVVPGIGRSRSSWERAARRWYDGGDARDVVVAADGPASWPRRDRVAASPMPRRTTGDAAVSKVRVDDDRISFDVSRTGIPVLVKVSYFPNWRASGADGPWRVTPNQMVVVPTSRTVILRYGRTSVDHAGWLVTLGGVAGLVLLARRGPVDMPVPAEPAPEPPRRRLPTRPSPKKRRR